MNGAPRQTTQTSHAMQEEEGGGVSQRRRRKGGGDSVRRWRAAQAFMRGFSHRILTRNFVNTTSIPIVSSVHVQSRAPSIAPATASGSGDCQTAAAARRGTVFIDRQGRSRRGSASLRRADAAQVCNNVGFVADDGQIECSSAKAARQIVSERWREPEGGPRGLKHLVLAATSAFEATKRRQTSRLLEASCSGVN
jgi:hypothetical protein